MIVFPLVTVQAILDILARIPGEPVSFPLPGRDGCNYTHFAPTKSEAEQFGVADLYHKNRALIQDQLGTMRKKGQTCIQIPLYY